MRVAVTGAAGFIGSHLGERLVADGHDVLGIDSFCSYYARAAKERNVAALRRAPGFELDERDVRGPGLARALAGAEAVCHLAGRPGVRSGSELAYEEGNVRTVRAVLHAAARADVRRVVLASSSSVYAPSPTPVAEDAPVAPPSAYGRSKLRAERVARRLAGELGVELVVLRYFTVYGPRQRPDMAFSRFVDAALSGRAAPLLGDGRQVRDFTYVGDAVDATARALVRGRPGATYNVAGGAPVALVEALEQIAAHAGRRPRLERRPRDPREHRATAARLDAAARDLGWRPRTPLAEGIARQLGAARAAYTLAA